MTVPFFLKRREPLLRLRQLCFCGCRARDQFRAALFVGSDARLPAIAFDQDLIEALAISAVSPLARCETLSNSRAI